MEIDGQVVAGWHGFRFGGADWHYQSGRNPSWDELSVGAVLLAHTIRDSVQSGIRFYRFLRGGEAYKFRFANADPGSETIAVGRGAAGRTAEVAAAAAVRLPPSAKSRLRRLAGG
jgi:CelD/BcsL family acetyltransferase involved in cellulose biosynthesis